MTLGSLAAIVGYMSQNNWMAEEKVWEPTVNGGSYEPTGRTNFSKMNAAGTVMLTVYVIPMLMRPKDFLYNFRGYFVGLITYLCLLPMFVNIMQVYGFCNLHDLSWGNRPTAAGGT